MLRELFMRTQGDYRPLTPGAIMGAPEWMHQDQEISPNFAAATVQVQSGQLENSQLPMGLPTTLQILIRERIRRSDIPTGMELDGFRFARQHLRHTETTVNSGRNFREATFSRIVNGLGCEFLSPTTGFSCSE